MDIMLQLKLLSIEALCSSNQRKVFNDLFQAPINIVGQRGRSNMALARNNKNAFDVEEIDF